MIGAMAIVVYWKYANYLADTEDGFAFHFNSNQDRLHDEVQVGDDVFAVTGVRTDHGFEVFLLAHLVVKAKTLNRPGYAYGKYRIWGDDQRSRYFCAGSESLLPVLEQMTSIRHFGSDEREKYAQAFQTIRKLGGQDTGLMRRFADGLVLHPRTCYRFPEKEYEESLENGDAVRRIVEAESISDDGEGEFIRRAGRNRVLVRDLNRMYGGRCQLCSFDPLTFYGRPLCAAHHIIYICRGGEDAMENLLLSCPNCHEAVHKCDAVFDWEDLNYRFDNGRVSPLVINDHLKQELR